MTIAVHVNVTSTAEWTTRGEYVVHDRGGLRSLRDNQRLWSAALRPTSRHGARRERGRDFHANWHGPAPRLTMKSRKP